MSKPSQDNLEELLNDNLEQSSNNNNVEENIDISISNNSNKCKFFYNYIIYKISKFQRKASIRIY